MNKKEKLFEVILSPTDMLEKELEDVLGGMSACVANNCKTNTAECEMNTCGHMESGVKLISVMFMYVLRA